MAETAEEFMRGKDIKFQKEKDNQEKHNTKGRKIRDILDTGAHYFVREAWTMMPQYNHPEKVFIIERFRRNYIKGKCDNPRLKVGDKEYRFGYFIVGKKGIAKNNWWWGQSCPLIPLSDLERLLKKARDEGTIEG